MYYFAAAIIIFLFCLGWIVCYFVMRNNPKYFNIDKVAKDELQALVNRMKERL